LGGPPLPEAEWEKLSQIVRKDARLPEGFALRPGDVLGSPTIRVLSAHVPDFSHPFPGQLIVRSEVVRALQEAQLTGFEPFKLDTQWGTQGRAAAESVPELFELMITGAVWRTGVDESSIEACHHCGRSVFLDVPWIIDEDRWTKTDFNMIDGNPNIVLVTSQVCDVLTRNAFSNWECLHISRQQ
jgi:hypothetical protein